MIPSKNEGKIELILGPMFSGKSTRLIEIIRKYTYKANFSVAAHMCRKYYRGTTSPPDLETIISRNLVPIRPDRHRVRYQSARIFRGFLYRVA